MDHTFIQPMDVVQRKVVRVLLWRGLEEARVRLRVQEVINKTVPPLFGELKWLKVEAVVVVTHIVLVDIFHTFAKIFPPVWAAAVLEVMLVLEAKVQTGKHITEL